MTTIPVSELQKAADRIGADEKKQLRWALELASNKDVASWGAGRWKDLQVELALFRGLFHLLPDFKKTAALPFRAPVFLTEEQARRVHERFVALLASYSTNNNEFHIGHDGKVLFDLVGGQFLVHILDPVTDCCVRLMKLAGQFSSHFRQCPACGRWFVGKKTDAIFCGKTCASRVRTTKFRNRQRKAK